MSENPYAPPRADLSRRAENPDYPGVWRDGSVLVMERDATLPSACIKCNAIGQVRLKRKLYWHHPAIFIALVFNLLLYFILALALRKSVTLEVGLCRAHRNRRRSGLMIGTVMVLLGLGSCSAGIITEQAVFTIGALFALTGMVVLVLIERVIWAKRIDADRVWIKGSAPSYLERFPALDPGA